MVLFVNRYETRSEYSSKFVLLIVLVTIVKIGNVVCIITSSNSIFHTQTNEHRRTVILPMVHDEYVSVYVGNPGAMLILRYDMYENRTFIFDDTEFRKHSQTFDILRCINHGSDIFYFGSEGVRLPIEIRRPQRYCTKFYDTFWIKYDGVLGLGVTSSIWHHWNSVHITPGRFQLGADEYFRGADKKISPIHPKLSVFDSISFTTSLFTLFSGSSSISSSSSSKNSDVTTHNMVYFDEHTITSMSTSDTSISTSVSAHDGHSSSDDINETENYKECDHGNHTKRNGNGGHFKAFVRYIDVQNDQEIHCEILWVTIEPSRETSLLPLKVFKHLFSENDIITNNNHLSDLGINSRTSDVNRISIHPISNHGDTTTTTIGCDDVRRNLKINARTDVMDHRIFKSDNGGGINDGTLELSASDFESQNFQGKYSRMLCEINMLDDNLILGRTCLHEKKYSYYHHYLHSNGDPNPIFNTDDSDDDYDDYDIDNQERRAELHNFEIGTFRSRLKKDSGSILSGIVTILIIGHVLGIIENAVEFENDVILTGQYANLPSIVILPIYKSTDVYLFLLDCYSLLLGWTCVIYYLLGVGMWESDWIICLPAIDMHTLVDNSGTILAHQIGNILCVGTFRIHIVVSLLSGLFCLFYLVIERYPKLFDTTYTRSNTLKDIETISEYTRNKKTNQFVEREYVKSTYLKINALINRITTISFLLVILWLYSTLPGYWTEFIFVYSSVCSSLCFVLNLLIVFLFLFNITSLLTNTNKTKTKILTVDGYDESGSNLPINNSRKYAEEERVNSDYDILNGTKQNKLSKTRKKHLLSRLIGGITKCDNLLRISRCVIQYVRCAHAFIWVISSAFVQYYMWSMVCNQQFGDSIYFKEILFTITTCVPLGVSLNMAMRISRNLNK